MSSRELIELPLNKWPALRDLYQQHKNEANSFQLINFFIRCMKNNAQLNFKIQVLNDEEWLRDGTFIATFQLANQLSQSHLFCNTLSADLKSLIEAFSLFDHKEAYLIHSFPERVMPAVVKYFEFCGNLEFLPNPTKWHVISREQVEQYKIDIPADIIIAPIKSEHIDYINSIWPHGTPDSNIFLQHLIEHNVSAAAYERDSGKLLAWCLQLPSGCLGTLQVEENQKRRGFGNLLVRYMAKQLMQLDCEIMAPVVPTNVASLSMFAKLGAVQVDTVYWAFKEKLE